MINVTCTSYAAEVKLTQPDPFTGVMYIKDRKDTCKQTYENVTTPTFYIKHDICSSINNKQSVFNLIVQSDHNKKAKGYRIKCNFLHKNILFHLKKNLKVSDVNLSKKSTEIQNLNCNWYWYHFIIIPGNKTCNCDN